MEVRGEGEAKATKDLSAFRLMFTLSQCVCVTLQLGKVTDDLYVAKNNPHCMHLPEVLSLSWQ